MHDQSHYVSPSLEEQESTEKKMIICKLNNFPGHDKNNFIGKAWNL
jgi:hypothetical protein